VTTAPTTVVLTSDPDPSSFGEAVTFTTTVSSGAGTPTGNVAFFEIRDDDTRRWLATEPLAAGEVTISTSTLPVGRHTIRAVYRGAEHFAAGTADTVQAVRRAATETRVTSWPDPSRRRSRVSIRAIVEPTPPGDGTPRGNVAFFRLTDTGRVWIATTSLRDGRATVTTSKLPLGRHTLRATYRGGPAHSASTGTTTHTVTAG
jgi:hypothetical protein